LTIRNWLDRHLGSPKTRTGVHAEKSGVITLGPAQTPEPPQPPQAPELRQTLERPQTLEPPQTQVPPQTPEPPQRDDFTNSSVTGPSNGRPSEPTAETILVAVRSTGEESRGQGNLTDDVGAAESIVTELVKSGVSPEAVSALRATEVPLTVSYEWTVQIGDKSPQRSRPRIAASPGGRIAASPGGNESSLLRRANEVMQDIMPEAPFQLRFDRLVWLGLWGGSLLILGLLLVASLSGGNAREFVIGGQPLPSASQSLGINVTAPPTALPSASPGVSAAAPVSSCLQGTINNCQCQDFGSQGEAQKFFNAYPPPNRQPVDPDGDGLVCEWLPKITASPRQ
jgi:hypothetical protein